MIRCMNAFSQISKTNKFRHTISAESKIEEFELNEFTLVDVKDMIKKGYARGNRDVDPRMMIPKTKPKDKQMKLPLKEKHMTDGEMKKREKIVMAMKPKMKGFKDRYGDDDKNVMYATATKMAMKKEDTNLFEKVKKRKVNQKKLAGNDKFEADPTLTSQIMRPDNPSNDNDNKI